MSEPPKMVYIITSGSYSDYNINCVFDTKEQATAYIKARNINEESYSDDDIQIEEYEINQTFSTDPKWFVSIARNGRIDSAYRSGIVGVERLSMKVRFTHNKENLYFDCRADSQEAAVKIANERRAALLAMNRWGINDE